MTLSITSDIVLAADDIDLGYPEIDVGLIPAIHYVHLPRQIGRHKAFELLFGGKPIPATEGVALGIVNHAVPRAALMDKAFEMASAYAAKSPVIMALGRGSFMRANDLDYRRNVKIRLRRCAIFSARRMGRRGCWRFWRSGRRGGGDAIPHGPILAPGVSRLPA